MTFANEFPDITPNNFPGLPMMLILPVNLFTSLEKLPLKFNPEIFEVNVSIFAFRFSVIRLLKNRLLIVIGSSKKSSFNESIEVLRLCSFPPGPFLIMV